MVQSARDALGGLAAVYDAVHTRPKHEASHMVWYSDDKVIRALPADQAQRELDAAIQETKQCVEEHFAVVQEAAKLAKKPRKTHQHESVMPNSISFCNGVHSASIRRGDVRRGALVCSGATGTTAFLGTARVIHVCWCNPFHFAHCGVPLETPFGVNGQLGDGGVLPHLGLPK